jgi:hypothetical protein
MRGKGSRVRPQGLTAGALTGSPVDAGSTGSGSTAGASPDVGDAGSTVASDAINGASKDMVDTSVLDSGSTVDGSTVDAGDASTGDAGSTAGTAIIAVRAETRAFIDGFSGSLLARFQPSALELYTEKVQRFNTQKRIAATGSLFRALEHDAATLQTVPFMDGYSVYDASAFLLYWLASTVRPMDDSTVARVMSVHYVEAGERGAYAASVKNAGKAVQGSTGMEYNLIGRALVAFITKRIALTAGAFALRRELKALDRAFLGNMQIAEKNRPSITGE